MGTIIRAVWRKLLVNKYTLIILLLLGIYSFLLGIELMGEGFKLMGKEFSESILANMRSPVSALFVGLLTTAVVQSSSCTTSIIVALCASYELTGGRVGLPIGVAIPAVMGANIGTTVTNILVSLAHIKRKEEFERAFSGATVHDFFNILCVIVLLPIEIIFHPLQNLTSWMAKGFVGIGGAKIASPIKFITEPIGKPITDLAKWLFGDYSGIAIIIIGGVGLFLALKVIVDCTKTIASRKFDAILNKYLFKAAWLSFLLGLGLTAFVQSSSVTTSIIIPFIGAGLLTVEKIYPYTLGANIGTTVTAIFAALALGAEIGIQIAFVHLMFNCIGTCIWYPLRKAPITLAKKLGNIAGKKRKSAILYIVITFYL
ncbi:MAG: Na/Pi symporter, partial [Candidatus Thermoplasmatota archaeon]